MLDQNLIVLIVGLLIFLNFLVGLVLAVLFQTAFQNKKMNDDNAREKQEYRRAVEQQEILKDFFAQENLKYHLKDVLTNNET